MDPQIKIKLMEEEISRLYSILNQNNIKLEQNISKSYYYYMRSIKSRQSIMRRICIKCRRNLTLNHFSFIDRKKRPHESICCNCIVNYFN